MTLSPDPPAQSQIIGLTYNLGPDGATFDPPITLIFTYDPEKIPSGVNEKDLVLALWDEATGKWVELTGCIVDTVTNTITAPVSHFSKYAILAKRIPAPPAPVTPTPTPAIPPTTPAAFTVSNLSVQPKKVEPKQAVTITVNIANTGGTQGTYTVALNINGVKEAEKSVTIAAGSSEAVTFSVTKESFGSYSVLVGNLTDLFTVVAPLPTGPVWWIWLILGIIVVVVVVVLWLVTKRWNE